MPVRASDIILDWAAKDGYSLSEAAWIRPQDHEFYFEVTEEKDGHRHSSIESSGSFGYDGGLRFDKREMSARRHNKRRGSETCLSQF